MMRMSPILFYMRISVEIDDELVTEAVALTGEKNKSPAIAKAVQQYVRRARAKEFGRLIREGAFDYPDATASLDPVPPLDTNR